jgi:hypothetical protein
MRPVRAVVPVCRSWRCSEPVCWASQRRMGHSDLKTTTEYLHFIEPEEHPMDKLPY